jgi:hypothetical protein
MLALIGVTGACAAFVCGSHGGAAASVHRTDGGTDAFADVGDLHAGCWAASDASLAASAHSNGDVLIWALPAAALPGGSALSTSPLGCAAAKGFQGFVAAKGFKPYNTLVIAPD